MNEAVLRTSLFRRSWDQFLVGATVFSLIALASLFGILTRPVGFLAAFWPANALLLAMMVRWPKLCSVSGWIGAVIGYLFADLVTGGGLLTTLWLTAANLAGALSGTLLFYSLSEDDRRLKRPLSVLYLLAISAAAGLACAIVGGAAATVLFNKGWVTGFAFWFTTELVNDLLLIAVILTIPPLKELWPDCVRMWNYARINIQGVLPVAALLLSLLVTVLVGGPGAIAFVVPALLWCSLTYQLFPTAVLTLTTLAGMMIAVSTGLIQVLPVSHDYIQETMSIRLGIALMALAPLTAASINQARNELIEKLNRTIKHDFLTDALARKSFLEMGSVIVKPHSRKEGHVSCAFLMIDIDHFKKINDTYGHPAGDEVLKTFSRTVQKTLRKEDLFGRLGGEEFAILLADFDLPASSAVAERIRQVVERTPIPLPDGRSLNITISLGLAFLDCDAMASLQDLLNTADEALYCAKTTGRNQVKSVVHNSQSMQQVT